MAGAKSKKGKPRGKPFQKGHKASVGNKGAKGKPASDLEERKAITFDKRLLSRYISLNLHLTQDELATRIGDPLTTAIEKGICQAILNFSHAGNIHMSDFLDRLIGPVKQHVEHSKADPFADMTDEELLEKKKQLAAINRITLQNIERDAKILQLREAQTIDVTPIKRDERA